MNDKEVIKDEETQDDVVQEEKKKTKKKSEKQKMLEEIDELKLENFRLSEKALRAIADAENYKKRIQHEREIEKKYSNQYLIEELIPMLDQFRVVVNMDVENEALKNYLIGFKMINDSLFNILEADGLTVIDAVGKKFDPKYHFATETTKDESMEKGIVIRQTQTGYMYKERIIRPAMVVVNEWSDENGNNK